MINVLSIDGGGIRGLIPAKVLSALEDEADAPIADLFDLVVGTSTGGILALGLTLADDRGDPAYTAADLADLYRMRGDDIFDQGLIKTITPGDSFVDERYPADGLEEVLEEYFGNATVGDALTEVVVTSYDIQNREPFFFMSWREEDGTVLAREAARATSAAPTYFEPMTLHAGNSNRVLIDGGVFVNNPAIAAFTEARALQEDHVEGGDGPSGYGEDEDVRIVSVGTGTSTTPISAEEARDWGLLGWAPNIYSIASDGVSDAVDYQLNRLLDERFHRFRPELRNASDAMDDASEENLNHLEQDADILIDSQHDRIQSVAEALAADRSG